MATNYQKPHDSAKIFERIPKGKALADKYIQANEIGTFDPYRWLLLAFNDLYKAPALSLFFGAIFAVIPALILHFAYSTGNWMFLLPASAAFALIGPAFATVLYDIAWQLEKGHKPSFKHSIKMLARNPAGEWAFAFVLLVLMIAWMRLAGIIYALYPAHSNPSIEELLPFLTLGSLVGAALTIFGFSISAFTPQLLLERRLDMMTAIATSMNAVRKNVKAMMVWAGLVFALILIGFATKALAFIIIMPLLSFASWHGYVAVVKTKHQRKYE